MILIFLLKGKKSMLEKVEECPLPHAELSVTGPAQVGLGRLQDSEPRVPRAPQCHSRH